MLMSEELLENINMLPTTVNVKELKEIIDIAQKLHDGIIQTEAIASENGSSIIDQVSIDQLKLANDLQATLANVQKKVSENLVSNKEPISKETIQQLADIVTQIQTDLVHFKIVKSDLQEVPIIHTVETQNDNQKITIQSEEIAALQVPKDLSVLDMPPPLKNDQIIIYNLLQNIDELLSSEVLQSAEQIQLVSNIPELQVTIQITRDLLKNMTLIQNITDEKDVSQIRSLQQDQNKLIDDLQSELLVIQKKVLEHADDVKIEISTETVTKLSNIIVKLQDQLMFIKLGEENVTNYPNQISLSQEVVNLSSEEIVTEHKESEENTTTANISAINLEQGMLILSFLSCIIAIL